MTLPGRTGPPQTPAPDGGRRGGKGLGARELAGAAAIAGLMALALGVTGRYFRASQRDGWRPPAGYRTVTYRVTGTARRVSVSFQPGPYKDGVPRVGLVGSTPFTATAVPWSHVEYLPPEGLASLTAIVHGPGEATAEVDVDGRPWGRERAVSFRGSGKSRRLVYGGEEATATVQQSLSPVLPLLRGQMRPFERFKP